MVWSINPYPCSIHGPSSLLAILYASLGWITLPRQTWWNIFQTKSSDSRAPSLGALDRGRSCDLVPCHGLQANTTERGLCNCAVDTRFERKMQTSCKLSIRSLLLNWFLTMIWYLALCAMWVTKSGTSGRALLTRKPQASQRIQIKFNVLQSKLQWRLLSFDQIHRSLNVGLPPSRARSILLQEIRHLAWKTDEPITT